MNWIQKSLDAAKMIPNESIQNLKLNCQERGDPQVGKSPQIWSRKVLFFWSQGRQALNKNGETRKWIRIYTKLRVLKKKIKQERRDP